VLNLITIILATTMSKPLQYQHFGKYGYIGHREFQLKSGNGAWVSVYYPCVDVKVKKEFDDFSFDKPEPAPGRPKTTLKYMPNGDLDVADLYQGYHH
jgi:hypothetical protein